MKTLQKNRKLAIHLILILGSLIMVLPFIWMILTALKSLSESVSVPPTLLPSEFRWENFSNVMKQFPFVNLYLNTLIMMCGRVLGSVLFSAMAAYAFARINFPFRNFLFSLILVQMMIPAQIFIIPQYLLVQDLGLLNSIPALIIPGIVSAFGTFLLRQFFMGLPDELEEAAKLDGCNIWQTFFKIMLPLARSGLIALAILHCSICF